MDLDANLAITVESFEFPSRCRVRRMANIELASPSIKPLTSGPALQRCINPLCQATFDVGQ